MDAKSVNVDSYFHNCQTTVQPNTHFVIQEKRISGLFFVKIAAISGALAVAFAAYGAHVLGPNPSIPAEQKSIFETGNKFHFLHTFALLAVPLTRKPYLTGFLFLCGILLFSGSCYTTGITGDSDVSVYTPYGGMFLIFAWLTIAL